MSFLKFASFASWNFNLPRFWRWLSLALFALALLALLFQFWVYIHYAVSLFRFPFDYDQGEGFELYDTVLHAQGQWPYQDSQVFPFYTSIYPPLFHLLTVPLVWAFGPQLWTGRVVGFAASLITAGAIGWGVQRASGTAQFTKKATHVKIAEIIATLSSLTYLASNYTFHIGPLFRQHITMVMFETLGIVALAQIEIHREDAKAAKEKFFASWRLNNSPMWLGLIFLLAAGYTKQLALATVLAGLGYLLLRGPRRAILAGIGLTIIAGGVFLWMNALTHGWWYISIIRANINTFDWGQAISFYKQWTSLHFVIAVIALSRLIYEIYFTRLSAYGVWLALALANGALSGKFGAGESYFVTTTAAACVLSGVALTKLWERSARWPRPATILLALAVPLLYLAQTRLTFHTYTDGFYRPLAQILGIQSESGYYDSQGYTQLGPRPTRADHEAGYQIAELARGAPGPVFSEEAAFLLVAGKPVVTNAFPQLVMYQAGLFDPTQEIAMINERAFGLVILRAQFYPPPVLQALGANYQPKTDIVMNHFIYRILEPRP